MDFLLCMENGVRETPGNILICEELQRRGYSAKILKHPYSIWHKYKEPVKVQITNLVSFFHNETFAVVGKVKKKVALQWEQLGWIGKPVNKVSHTSSSVNVMAWGDYTAEKFKRSGMKESRIHKTGAIHLDFLRPEFKSIYQPRGQICSRYGLNTEKRILLFIGGKDFTAYDPTGYAIRCGLDGKEKTDYNERWWRDTTDLLSTWFERFLLLHSDEWQIVYRRHPDTRPENILMDLEDKYSDFHVVSELSGQQWLVIADVLATVDSTMTAEAYFLGKKILITRPNKMEYHYNAIIFDGFPKIDSYEEFESSVLADHGHRADDTLIKRIYDNDDIPAYMKICDALEVIYHDSEYDMIWDEDEFKDIICQYKMERKLLIKSGYFLKWFTIRLFKDRIFDIIYKRGKKRLLYRLFGRVVDYDKRANEKQYEEELTAKIHKIVYSQL